MGDNRMNMIDPSPIELIRAHQYLYYVKVRAVLMDYEYDRLRHRLGIDLPPASREEADYTDDEKALAELLELSS